MKDKWKISVHGYGTFDFEGTEEEAEFMRAHKSRWERGVGTKWRVPPDANCVTLPNGDCVGADCMHSKPAP